MLKYKKYIDKKQKGMFCMKFRQDFVTNSSSSSFIVSICINLKDGNEIRFDANGGTPECGRIDYFEGDAIVNLSPKQMATAESVEKMIEILAEGVIDGDEYMCYDDENCQCVKIFEKSRPVDVFTYGEDFDYDNPKTTTIDAYDFVKEIKENIKSMDDISSIEICGSEENYMCYRQTYTYDKENGEYSGFVEGCEFEKDGASGGTISIPDREECSIEYEPYEE
jgi:hypothetical protein